MLATYNLYLRRRLVSQDWRKSYEDCIAKLESAASGNMSLGLDDAGNAAGPANPVYRTDTTSEDRIYTEDKLGKF